MIGAGWFGTLASIPALLDHPDAELVGICDTDPVRAREAADRFGVARWFTDVETMLAAGIADGVVVAVSQVAHYPVCRAALDAGLHVLVEKPMVLRAVDAWDLVRRAEERNLILLVGETFHFTSVAAQVRARLRAGAIGDLLQIVGTFNSHTERLFRGGTAMPDGRGGSYADPRLSGGGQGHTQLSHLAGVLFWSSGLRIREVFGYLDNRDLAVDLVDSIVGRLSNGALLSVSATGTMPAGHPPRNRLEYYGTEGAIIHDLSTATADVQLPERPTERLVLRDGEPAYPLAAPAIRFAELIAGAGTDNPAPAEAAARCVEFLDAAYLSAATGKPVGLEELAG
ncbi:MAG TPA: Gfo/Idh/MocA family oxidoreductase [Mycobacteriales bacterium]|nr:Gfo/Idh/MocA family oxidoreductase [Mycobacteriales bacterium]